MALYKVIGSDQYGVRSEIVVDIPPERPDLYFWLGADAEPKEISAIVPAIGSRYVYPHRHISCGFEWQDGEFQWFERRI